MPNFIDWLGTIYPRIQTIRNIDHKRILLPDIAIGMDHSGRDGHKHGVTAAHPVNLM
jgi:hypothetical protein